MVDVERKVCLIGVCLALLAQCSTSRCVFQLIKFMTNTYRYSRCGKPRKASSSMRSNEFAVNNLRKRKKERKQNS